MSVLTRHHQKTGQGQVVRLPETAPDPNATVIAVEIEGELQTVPVPVLQTADGKLKLEAEDADIAGKTMKLEQRHGHKMAIVNWTDANDQVSWPVRLSKPGTFEVEASVTCPPGSEGSTVIFSIGDQAITAAIPATKSEDDFTRLKLGRVKVEKPGDYTATIKATQKAKGAIVNLESITLVPGK